MDKKLVKYLVTALAYLAVLYPLWVRLSVLTWRADLDVIFQNLFPAFGLTAFSILWLHSMSGFFEPWLRNLFDFDQFVRNSSMIIFFCIILHPLLLFITMDFNLSPFFKYGGWPIRLGVIGWFLLITYDVGKALKKYDFFVRNWNNILIISTIGFLLTFFHSLKVGSDLQIGNLRTIWMFYGVTAIIATAYTYGFKRFMTRAIK